MDRQSAPPSLNVVTVVYAEEVDLLAVQARSIAIFLSPVGIRSIQVIVNDRNDAACLAAVEALRPEYGAFAPLLEVMTADEVFAARPDALGPRGPRQRLRDFVVRHRHLYPPRMQGGWRGNRGWAIQQAIKLGIARCGDSDFVLLLDAKNHFVRPVGLADFIGAEGRARSFLGHPSDAQWSWIEGSFAVYGQPAPRRDALAPPSTTPFCLERDVLRGCVDSLEERVGPAEAYFGYQPLRRPRVSKGSEFMMIYAYVVWRYGSWEARFDEGLVPAASINRKADAATADLMLSLIEDGTANVMSIHNSRRHDLTPEQRSRVQAIWAERGLEAASVLAAPRAAEPTAGVRTRMARA